MEMHFVTHLYQFFPLTWLLNPNKSVMPADYKGKASCILKYNL